MSFILRKRSIIPVFTGSVATTALTSTTTTFTVNYPSGSSNGDYIVIIAYFLNIASSAITPTTPTGWTLITSNNPSSADALGGWTYGKFRGAETSVAITVSPAEYCIATATSFLGSTVSASAPVNVSTASVSGTGTGAISTTASTTCSPASITTTIENCALVLGATSVNTAGATSFTYTWGAAYTARAGTAAQIGSLADEMGCTVATGVQVTAGATGTATCTSSVSTNYIYPVAIALAPATG